MGAIPNDFRYFLTYNSQRIEVFSPKSWEDGSTVSYKRDVEYFGMVRSWALPLEFIENGAKILRAAWYQDGVEAGVIFEVEQLNRATLVYEPAFKGDIDFSKAIDEGGVFSATLMQAGPSSRIKAYENTKYEYNLVGDDVINMILPGVPFKEGSDSIITPVFNAVGGERYIPGSVATRVFQSGFVETQNVSYERINDGGFSSSENWFVKANRIITVQVSGRIKGSYDGGPASIRGYTIEIRDNTNAVVYTLKDSNSQREPFDIPFNLPFNLIDGQKLFFYCRIRSGNATRIYIDEGEFQVSYDNVSDPSNCKGIKSADLFKRIIKRISPGLSASSYLLSNTWANLIFTSGNAIRGIVDSKIKISLKEFFQTCNGIDDAGMGMENDVLRLENKYYFARLFESVNVGEIGDDACNIEPAVEFMGSNIKVGYDDKNTEDKDGLKEYNSGQEWELPISRLQNELNWMSAARADQYGIEKLRVTFNVLNIDNTRGTDDTPSDNDTFMVDCYLDGEYYKPILGSSYQSVTWPGSGQAGNLSYNLRITPKKNLLRHGSYLRSIMYPMDSRYVNFASAVKNAGLKTVKDSIGVKEDEDILVASLPEKYFMPYVATIRCKLPYGAKRMIDANPFGFGRFIWKGATIKGYILEMTIDIARNTEQELKLLLTNDNNLLKLIR